MSDATAAVIGARQLDPTRHETWHLQADTWAAALTAAADLVDSLGAEDGFEVTVEALRPIYSTEPVPDPCELTLTVCRQAVEDRPGSA
jgi:hypothetical protein